ncbi:MAG: rhomboid family intramembrane serine protease [Polyangiales bacterium]
MIPLRDINPHRSSARVTYSIIAINIVVFVYQWSLGPAQEAFIFRYGVVPYWLSTEPQPGSLITPLTSMFMHGGVLHIVGNMWFLHVFGDNVEHALGSRRFLFFYLLCGILAALTQVAIDPTSKVPMVGASGAIAGVLAGYVVLFPRARILTLVPIFIFLQFVEIPAIFFTFIWFGYQLLMGYTALGRIGAGVGGVAFFAHIGGFVAGLAVVRWLRKRPRPTAGFRPPPAQRQGGYRKNERW